MRPANTDAGWSSLVARRAHNPKVVGSNPAPATNFKTDFIVGFFVSEIQDIKSWGSLVALQPHLYKPVAKALKAFNSNLQSMS